MIAVAVCAYHLKRLNVPPINQEKIDMNQLIATIHYDENLALERQNSPEKTIRNYVRVQITRSPQDFCKVLTVGLAQQMGMDSSQGAFGVSSPWVDTAYIEKGRPIGENKWEYKLQFLMATSQGIIGKRNERVRVEKVDREYRVNQIIQLPVKQSGQSNS